MKTRKILMICLVGAFLNAGWIGSVSAQEMDDGDAQPTVRERGNAQRGEGGRSQGRGRQAEGNRQQGVQPLTPGEIRILRKIIADYRSQQGGETAAEEASAKRPDGKGEVGPGARGRGPSPEMRQRMLERFDADGDGMLSPDERSAARETLQEERQQRQQQQKQKKQKQQE